MNDGLLCISFGLIKEKLSQMSFNGGGAQQTKEKWHNNLKDNNFKYKLCMKSTSDFHARNIQIRSFFFFPSYTL